MLHCGKNRNRFLISFSKYRWWWIITRWRKVTKLERPVLLVLNNLATPWGTLDAGFSPRCTKIALMLEWKFTLVIYDWWSIVSTIITALAFWTLKILKVIF
jgi:hypothetical protein